jgi:Xaa-Pro aminopeptidase
MKTDINLLMQQNNVEALFITGAGQHNPFMVYFTGTRHLTSADLLLKHNQEPILFHGPMEREEAARSGLKTCSYNSYPMGALQKQANGNRSKAMALRYKQMLSDTGITQGLVLVYGNTEAGTIHSILSELNHLVPDLEFQGDFDGLVLSKAMMTKDDGEIDRIRQMGKITTEVVGMTADFLTSHATRNEMLVKPDGDPLCIKDVKRQIDLWLAERGADNPEGTIFAIAHDAGVPHSTGNPEDFLRLGQTIVFDIFPCEAGGGYYYDFTRTWCLGYAPDEVQRLYEDVYAVYQQMLSEMKAGIPGKVLQKRTCELFKARGHATLLDNPETEEGYVHSLGHGVGLNVHEKPWSGSTATDNDILAPGVVFTIEPGLYYPARGMGVRLEDSVWVRKDGQAEILAPYPLDLVLPVR